MRWLADECVDAALVAQLRATGHDVAYMAELAPSTTDIAVIHLAQREGRLLLTEDKDFGELVFRWKVPVPGLVLLRMEPEQKSLKWLRLLAAVDKFGDTLFGRYTVVEAARLRARQLRPNA